MFPCLGLRQDAYPVRWGQVPIVKFHTRHDVINLVCVNLSKEEGIIMGLTSSIAATGLALLAACDVDHQVAVVGPNNAVFTGIANATFLECGWFQASNGSTTCQGRYRLASAAKVITYPVTCSSGLRGVGAATYETSRAGGGEIVMKDCGRWKFILAARHCPSNAFARE
jgi:hypothetical protein